MEDIWDDTWCFKDTQVYRQTIIRKCEDSLRLAQQLVDIENIKICISYGSAEPDELPLPDDNRDEIEALKEIASNKDWSDVSLPLIDDSDFDDYEDNDSSDYSNVNWDSSASPNSPDTSFDYISDSSTDWNDSNIPQGDFKLSSKPLSRVSIPENPGLETEPRRQFHALFGPVNKDNCFGYHVGAQMLTNMMRENLNSLCKQQDRRFHHAERKRKNRADEVKSTVMKACPSPLVHYVSMASENAPCGKGDGNSM